MGNAQGMSTIPIDDTPIPVNRAARILRIPARWLRAECDAGRLPSIAADRVRLVSVPQIRAALLARLTAAPADGGGAR